MEGEEEEYKRKDHLALLIIMVFAFLAIVSVFVALSYYCYLRNKLSKLYYKKGGIDCENKGGSALANTTTQLYTDKRLLQLFTFKQLHSATGGFGKSSVIGHGAFGLVYRGVLPNGRKVAVKVMDRAGRQGEDEFQVEVELLSRLRSPYLLALIGYCSESNHKLLVYEFMTNGGLQEHLYPVSGSKADPSLSWETRLRIALEAAKGLEYLHEHVNPPVIHRDFKSSNILLDINLHAKVSDFGLAKLGSDKAGGHVSTRVLGTQGYVAPEYALTGHLTTKSDVYSYGVVLLELLTGRVPVDMKRAPGEGVLVSWALPRLTDREKVVHIMDPALEGQYSMKEVIQVAAIAAMCVQPEAEYRPLMADVVQSLVPLVRHLQANSKGTSWTVALGRRDARTASQSAANSQIPAPSSSLSTLISMFSANGLSANEHGSLPGNTSKWQRQLGLARCPEHTPVKHILSELCGKTWAAAFRPGGLFNGGSTVALVRTYVGDNTAFLRDLAAAMAKLGNISPLTGTNGDIMKNCKVPN